MSDDCNWLNNIDLVWPSPAQPMNETQPVPHAPAGLSYHTSFWYLSSVCLLSVNTSASTGQWPANRLVTQSQHYIVPSFNNLNKTQHIITEKTHHLAMQCETKLSTQQDSTIVIPFASRFRGQGVYISENLQRTRTLTNYGVRRNATWSKRPRCWFV